PFPLHSLQSPCYMSAPVSPRHLPVLAAEVMELLAPATGETWVDATVGAGGHTRLLAERVGPTGLVIGLDRDVAMLNPTRERLAGLPLKFVKASFDEIDAVLRIHGLSAVDGVLADLGICSDQLDDPERGLSFQLEGPLDM